MALTKSDKNWVENILENKLSSALELQEQKFEAKMVEIKDDFFTKIDPILKEVMASREERVIIAHQIKNHGDRIEKIEKKLGLQTV